MNKTDMRLRRKVLMKWCNLYLSKRGQTVTNLQTDFRSGLNLVLLYEILTTNSLLSPTPCPHKKYSEDPSKFPELRGPGDISVKVPLSRHLSSINPNLSRALERPADEMTSPSSPPGTPGQAKDPLPPPASPPSASVAPSKRQTPPGPPSHPKSRYLLSLYQYTMNQGLDLSETASMEEIDNGVEEATLKLLSLFAMKYQIIDEEHLLKWIQGQITRNYPITNFSRDWMTGIGLCWLVEAVNPDSIPRLPFSLTYDPIVDTHTALSALEDTNIPLLLDVEDITDGPDYFSMALFLSYFRDYAPQKTRKKLKLNPCSNEPDHIIICGGTLKCMELGEHKFILEVRNVNNQCIGYGGHNITVEIVSSNFKHKANITDKNNGTYELNFSVQETGIIEIHIYFQDPPISGPVKGSPFSYYVNSKPHQKPVPHWFVVLDAASNKYRPYSKEISDFLESSKGKVTYDEYLSFDLTSVPSFEITNNKTKREIVRGTWFWRCDDGSWAPYEKSIAERLENTFGHGFVKDVVVIKERSKLRHVVGLSDGSFRQYRIAPTASQGRAVTRGYLGQLHQAPRLHS